METPLVKSEYIPEPDGASTQLPGSIPSLLEMEAQIREASNAAESRGDDPARLRISDIAQGSTPVVPAALKKFQTPTGEVDVEKLKASSRQLDEAIQRKEEALKIEEQKTIDDYLAKQKKFGALPNAEKVRQAAEPAPVLPPPPQIPPQHTLTLDEMKAQINANFQRDQAGTVLDLLNIGVEEALKRKLGPLEREIEERKIEKQDRQLRDNLMQLAEKDPRVMNESIFNAINAKLEANPELWNLRNPHKAAYLEVKDEMRLGDPIPGQPQPSRLPSPILGGGTPPPPQSSVSTVINPDNVSSAIRQMNFKDKAQVQNVEKALKELVDAEHRRGY